MATKPIFDDVAPWPVQKQAEPNPRAVMGNNAPPPEEAIPAEFRAALLDGEPDFLQLVDDYLGVGDPNSEGYKEGAVHRAKADSEETLASCGKVINALRLMEKRISDTHTAIKAPYLLAGRLVDAEKNALVGRIAIGRNRVQGLMDAYAQAEFLKRKAEEQRRAEEQAVLEKLATENNLEAALPPPPPPAPRPTAPIRTDGATVSLGTEWVGTVTDYSKAFKKVKDDAKVKEAIDAAIKRIVKATKGAVLIPGVTITEQAKTSAR